MKSRFLSLMCQGALWLSILWLGFLSVVSLVSSAYIDKEDFLAEHICYRRDNLFVNLLVLGIFFLALWWFEKRIGIERLNTKFLAALSVSFVVAMSVIWIFISYTVPRADQQTVSMIAYLATIDNWWFFQDCYYIQVYPFQLGVTAFMELLYHLAGGENWKVFMFVSALSNGAIVYLLYKITDRLFHSKRINHLILLLSMGCVHLILYTTFLYGNTLGLALSLAAFFFSLKFLERKKFVDGLFSALFMGAAILIKANYSIFLVAMVLLLIDKALEEKSWRPVLLILALLVSTKAMEQGLQSFYEYRLGDEISTGMPKSLHIAMGMQEGSRAEGWCNDYNINTYVSTGCCNAKSDAIAKESIRESLETFKEDPAYALKFYYRKTVSQWNEPTYEAQWVNSSHVGDFSVIVQSIYDGKLYRALYEYMNLYQSLIFVMAFACLLLRRKKWRMEELFFFVVVLGGFLFHTLWEAKSQYIYTYFVMLLPYGAAGLSETLSAIRPRLSGKAV